MTVVRLKTWVYFELGDDLTADDFIGTWEAAGYLLGPRQELGTAQGHCEVVSEEELRRVRLIPYCDAHPTEEDRWTPST
jgi:hypothetical protein